MSAFDYTPAESSAILADWIAEMDEPRYRAGQILPRLWQRPVRTWAETTDLPAKVVGRLIRDHPIPRLHAKVSQRSRDGTVKTLWQLHDGLGIESVWIPEGRRSTLCISSQAGCAYGCAFCATGRMGFQRHLSPSEIVAQVRECVLDPDLGLPTNVVFMGMGEPLHNWPNVDTALTILNDPRGFGIGARRITISTIGLVPQLTELAERPEQFNLAVSLHAAVSSRRAALMPIEKKYPLSELLIALDRFKRRLTFEYVMIKGANDSLQDADALSEIAQPRGAHVNLLPLHPGGAPRLVPTPASEIRRFGQRLEQHGVRVTIRRSRGLDINAACGQLRIQEDLKERRRGQESP